MKFSTRKGNAWPPAAASSGFSLMAVVAASSILLSACASNQVDGRGVMNAQMVPANALQCEDVTWRYAERTPPRFPPDLLPLFAHRDQGRVLSLDFSFDVEQNGSTSNIRFVAPDVQMPPARLQRTILLSAETISQWRFEHEGPEVFVTGCSTRIDFSV